MPDDVTRLSAEHGIVVSRPDDPRGYLGWPTVTRTRDGQLVVVASGMRTAHVCPWGRTVLCTSPDEGRTWTDPVVVNDSVLDDRDAGIVELDDGSWLLTWFTSDTRRFWRRLRRRHDPATADAWRAEFATWPPRGTAGMEGPRTVLSTDGGATWSEPRLMPVTSPHGPIQLSDGSLLHLGKRPSRSDPTAGPVVAIRSVDAGASWQPWGRVPFPRSIRTRDIHEPHVVELPADGGRPAELLGAIRVHGRDGALGVATTRSIDGGRTWSRAERQPWHGTPPHLWWHSSGVVVMTYGYRLAPYGQRVALSHDRGRTWTADLVLRDDGPDLDLGYPSTVELGSGELFTVAYQKLAAGEHPSLLWSRWSLPDP